MNYRDATILSPVDVGASGTKVVDIDVSKPISRIEIRFKTTKTLGYMTAPGPANISRIELVTGSTPLHSLTGYENQALAYYNRPGVSMEHGQHIDGSSEMDNYVIDFGRHLWDEMLAFDPTRFSNPQLKITFDEDVADTGVSANELEIRAKIFDEKAVTPIGFLSAIEHYDYTCGANNSFETIEMPEDRVYRQLLVRAFYQGYEPWYNIDEARFDEGTLDRIPWEFTSLEAYYRMMKAVWTPIQTTIIGIASAGGRVFYVPSTDYWTTLMVTNQGNGADLYMSGASMRGGKATLISASASQFTGMSHGYLPWHCYQFPMGKQDVIEDWYDPAGKKPRLRLRASTGATSATGQVVIEELHKY